MEHLESGIAQINHIALIDQPGRFSALGTKRERIETFVWVSVNQDVGHFITLRLNVGAHSARPVTTAQHRVRAGIGQ